MQEDIEAVLISEEQIRFKVQELGMQITRDYQGKNLLLLGTLKGAIPFIADLELIRKPKECGRIGKNNRKEERRPWQEHTPGK